MAQAGEVQSLTRGPRTVSVTRGTSDSEQPNVQVGILQPSLLTGPTRQHRPSGRVLGTFLFR